MKASIIIPLLALAGLARADEPRPTVEGATQVFALHEETGWFDDAFALDGDGGKLVVVHSDTAGAGETARVIDLAHPDAAPVTFDLVALGGPPAEVHTIANGSQLLALVPEADGVVALVLGPGGKVVRKLGPASSIARARSGNNDVLALLDTKPGIFTITIVKPDTGATLVKRKLTFDGAGRIAALGLTFIGWRAHDTQLVGTKEGAYDKKADRRLPDSEVTYDLVAGKVVAEVAPADLVEHARVLAARRAHEGADQFVTWTEDAQGLEAISRDDRRVRLTLATPIADYDPQSLEEESTEDGRLAFSLGDGKAFDLYVVDLGAPTVEVTRVAHIPTTGHPVRWHVSGNRVAVLFKHKTFEHGGTDVVVYDLGK